MRFLVLAWFAMSISSASADTPQDKIAKLQGTAKLVSIGSDGVRNEYSSVIQWQLTTNTVKGEIDYVVRGDVRFPERNLALSLLLFRIPEIPNGSKVALETYFDWNKSDPDSNVVEVAKGIVALQPENRRETLLTISAKTTGNQFVSTIFDAKPNVKSALKSAHGFSLIFLTGNDRKTWFLEIEKGPSGTNTFNKSIELWDKTAQSARPAAPPSQQFAQKDVFPPPPTLPQVAQKNVFPPPPTPSPPPAAPQQKTRLVPNLKAHYLWQIQGVDELSSTARTYRRYAKEGNNNRNVLVFSCPLDPNKKVFAEFIPPTFLLPQLKILTSNASTTGNVEVSGNKIKFKRSGPIDPIAAFIDFDDSEIPKMVMLLGEPKNSISFFDDQLAYIVTADMETSKQISAAFSEPHALKEIGSAKYISSVDVVEDCMKVRTANKLKRNL